MENCTFKPKINQNISVSYPNDISVYEKLSKPSLDRERLKVYENVKTIIEMKECTFRPKVNKTILQSRKESRSQVFDTFDAITLGAQNAVAYKQGQTNQFQTQYNSDLYSDNQFSNSKSTYRGDGRSPITGKRFERLFAHHKDQADRLEKIRAEEKERKDNEFDFKPKFYTKTSGTSPVRNGIKQH